MRLFYVCHVLILLMQIAIKTHLGIDPIIFITQFLNKQTAIRQ